MTPEHTNPDPSEPNLTPDYSHEDVIRCRTDRLLVGARVTDAEADDDSTAVILDRPSLRLSEARIQTDDGVLSVAELNPEYDPEGYVADVAFITDLDREMGVTWRRIDRADLVWAVRDSDVTSYTYPIARLEAGYDD